MRTDIETEKEVIRLYTTPTKNGWMGAYEISKALGISKTTVQNILIRNNVGTRDSKQALEGKRTKPIKNLPVGSVPLCKCGCGKPVEWNQRKNKWNVYREGHYRKPHLYKDGDWLRSEYESGKSLAAIAGQFGVFVSTVAKFAKKLGVKLRPHRESLRISGLMNGSNNSAWKGGVTPERQKVYKTGEWTELVKYIYERDGYKCQRCNGGHTRQNKLHAHHIKSWADNPALRLAPSNLITLCDTCHRWVHSRKNINQNFL